MPTDSAYPLLEIPDVDIWSFLFENKQRPFPDDQVIYVDATTSRSYTYAQIKSTAIAFGTGLKALWVWQKGDVLASYTPNSIDFPPVIWGTHWAGGIISPVNPTYTVNELVFQLRDAGAKALITQLAHLPVAVAAAKEVGLPEDRIILLGDDRDPLHRFKHFSAILNPAGTNRYRKTKMDPDNDLAFLVYSSGTTGLPKGVMLSHRNIVANILQLKAGEGENLRWDGGLAGHGDVLLGFLPFFHVYGLSCMIHQCMYSGWTLVVMAKFDIDDFCRNIQTYKVTYAYIVPPVVLLLGKHPVIDKYDLSTLRMLNSGAAPLTQELVDAVYLRIKVPIKQGYGLSEMSPTTHTQPWERWQTTIGSVGTMLPNQTAKYMSADEIEVPVGETGELWIKGPNVFKGYLNNPKGTSNAITPDGYFKTGDIGHQDKNGNFYITDRLKELIKYKGFQVAPAELEGLLLSHADVQDVAVIGVYDEKNATEVPRAYVVLRPGAITHAKDAKSVIGEIVQWLEPKVAQYKRLRGGIRIVNEIPKSASGKILRRILRDEAEMERKTTGRLKL